MGRGQVREAERFCRVEIVPDGGRWVMYVRTKLWKTDQITLFMEQSLF